MLEAWGSVQKSPSSKATGNFERGAYTQYVSTQNWRERRWRLFSTDPIGRVGLDIQKGGLIALFIIISGLFGSPFMAEANQSAWESANRAGLQAYRQGRYADAKELFVKALAEAKRSGEPNPSQAMTLNNLAAVHEALGESEEAELRYQQSLYVIESIQGPQHPDLIPGLNNLALLYIQNGKFQQAEPLLKRRLAILESSLGTGHAHLIPNLLVLAQLAQAQGRLGEAEQFYAKALNIADSELDPRHPHKSRILLDYAALLRHMKRDAEAAILEEQAKAIQSTDDEKN